MRTKSLSITALAAMSVMASLNSVSPVKAAQANANEVYERYRKEACDRTVEVFHRSNTLRSPDGRTKVYVESIYRRQGVKNGKHFYLFTECVSPNRQRNKDVETPAQRIVVEVDGKRIEKTFSSNLRVNSKLEPVSFSPDGKLVVLGETTTISGEGYHSFEVLALENLSKEYSTSCIDPKSGYLETCFFQGFLSNDLLAIHVGNGISRAYYQFSSAKEQFYKIRQGRYIGRNYGKVTRTSEVTKIQRFSLQ